MLPSSEAVRRVTVVGHGDLKIIAEARSRVEAIAAAAEEPVPEIPLLSPTDRPPTTDGATAAAKRERRRQRRRTRPHGRAR